VNSHDDRRFFEAKLMGGYDWLHSVQYAAKRGSAGRGSGQRISNLYDYIQHGLDSRRLTIIKGVMIKSCMPWIHRALVFSVVALGCGVASANDVYIAQSAVGSNNGSSCANALAYGYFNTAGNWTTSAPTGTKIGPGTVVHLCGTITGAAGANPFLQFQ